MSKRKDIEATTTEAPEDSAAIKRPRLPLLPLFVPPVQLAQQLVPAPQQQKSQYKGVSFRKAQNKYIAQIRYNKKLYDLGSYDRQEDAARAYDKASLCAKGVNSNSLNFHEYPAEERQKLSRMKFEQVLEEVREAARNKKPAGTSKYKGVRKSSKSSFEAYIRVAKTFVSLGSYQAEEAAAEVYDQAAILRHFQGVSAASLGAPPKLVTNFPLSRYQCIYSGGEENPGATSEQNPVTILNEDYVQHIVDLCNKAKAGVEGFRTEFTVAATEDVEEDDDDDDGIIDEEEEQKRRLQQEQLEFDAGIEALWNALNSLDPAIIQQYVPFSTPESTST